MPENKIPDNIIKQLGLTPEQIQTIQALPKAAFDATMQTWKITEKQMKQGLPSAASDSAVVLKGDGVKLAAIEAIEDKMLATFKGQSPGKWEWSEDGKVLTGLITLVNDVPMDPLAPRTNNIAGKEDALKQRFNGIAQQFAAVNIPVTYELIPDKRENKPDPADGIPIQQEYSVRIGSHLKPVTPDLVSIVCGKSLTPEHVPDGTSLSRPEGGKPAQPQGRGTTP